MSPVRGSCLCGGVKFEITGPLSSPLNCHCSLCRKQHAAPFRSRARAQIKDFRWLEGEAEAIARKAIAMAKGGDMAAIRVCMDRLAPARRSAAIACELPPLENGGDAVSAMAAVIAAVAAGEVTPAEAASLARVIDRYMFARSLAQYEDRPAATSN